ncbi:hypothetical protein [Amycolatopsis sp. NPDC051903]|uniref:hypothetical protein n=1 Tax=Amycolatopsis sp. NPDC051903 TaxID=3363936 RepID=UPI0037B3E6B5
MRCDLAVLPAAVRRVWGAPAGVAAVSTVAFVLVSTHLTDDAYATLSYARNLAFHAHWGLVEQSTATSPLHVLVLAAVTVVVRNAVVAAGVVYVGSQVALVLGLKRLAARTGAPRPFAALAFAALLVNPLLVSAVGLEVALGAAIAVWVLVFAAERRPCSGSPRERSRSCASTCWWSRSSCSRRGASSGPASGAPRSPPSR